jgi:hypothetical protein
MASPARDVPGASQGPGASGLGSCSLTTDVPEGAENGAVPSGLPLLPLSVEGRASLGRPTWARSPGIDRGSTG